MRKLISTLVFVAVTAVALAGCGGGDSKSVKIPGGGEVTTSDKLPSSFPGDFPIYDGAKVQGSVSGTAEGITGTTVTWVSDDSVEKVKDFFDTQFAKDSWKSESNGTIDQGGYWVGKSKDGSKAFYAYASPQDGQDGKTSIIVTVGDNKEADSNFSADDATRAADDGASSSDSGSSDVSDSASESPAPRDLPAEVKLDKNFPTDRVPLPSGARVTGSTSFGSATAKTYSVVFLTKDDADKVAQYFSDEMPSHGWADAYTANSDGQVVLTFTAGDGGSSSGEVLTVGAGESGTSPGYTEVSVTVSVVAAEG